MTRESNWIDVLAREAERDLVFLWHITGGRLGGTKPQPDQVLATLARVSDGLLTHGCVVGFGNPDSPDWHELPELQGLIGPKGKVIAELWNANPAAYEFLVFALRKRP